MARPVRNTAGLEPAPTHTHQLSARANGCMRALAWNAEPEVRIHFPPAESPVRTCLSREFSFLGREAGVFRGCAGGCPVPFHVVRTMLIGNIGTVHSCAGFDTQHGEAVLRVWEVTRSTKPGRTSVELAVRVRVPGTHQKDSQ
jgi:hypothetical protein